MRAVLLITLWLIIAEVAVAEPFKEEIKILKRKPRSVQDWFPVRLISRIFGWGSSNDDLQRSETDGDNTQGTGDATQSTILSLRIFNPIRTLVTQATSAASNAFSGIRNRVSATLTSFSDYIENGIPYAKDLSPYSQENGPEYAKGQEIPHSSYDDAISERKYDWDLSSKNDKTPEEVYQEYTDRMNKINRGYSNYDKYYQIHGTSRQLMNDYEQLMEKDKKDFEKDDPLMQLTKMFTKLQEAVRSKKR